MLKALIVEDNRLNRETLQGLFMRHFPSIIVEEASNGKEATQKVKAFHPDLILMDIQLPDASGLELTREIKMTNPDTRVLILTGHHYPEYREAAAQYGADGFLVKGGSSKEIITMVESFFLKAEGSTIAEKK